MANIKIHPSVYQGGEICRFAFGAYGDTIVYAAREGVSSALDNAASMLDVGFFSEPDYPQFCDDACREQCRLYAEVDHTYTESGWLIASEWSMDDIDTMPLAAAIAACGTRKVDTDSWPYAHPCQRRGKVLPRKRPYSFKK